MQKNLPWIRAVWAASGVYDLILGVAFLAAWPALYGAVGIALPNHPGYVQFPALVLLIFAAMFFRIASNPAAHRGLMPYGIGLKAAYCLTIAMNLGAIPSIWVVFAVLDLVFLVLFVLAWRCCPRAAAA